MLFLFPQLSYRGEMGSIFNSSSGDYLVQLGRYTDPHPLSGGTRSQIRWSWQARMSYMGIHFIKNLHLRSIFNWPEQHFCEVFNQRSTLSMVFNASNFVYLAQW